MLGLLTYAALWLAIIAILLVMFGIAGGRTRRPECAGCRYPLQGLTTTRCPECGGDLEGKGTRPTGSLTWTLKPPDFVRVLCTLLLLGPFAIIGLSVLWTKLPALRVSDAAAVASYVKGAQSWRIEISARGSITAFRTDPAFNERWIDRSRLVARLLIDGRGEVGRIELRDTRRRADLTAGGLIVSTPDGIAPEDIGTWLKACGIDEASAADEAITRQIHTLIATAASNAPSEPSGTGPLQVLPLVTNYQRPVLWLLIPALVIGAVVLIFLVLALLRLSAHPIVVDRLYFTVPSTAPKNDADQP